MVSLDESVENLCNLSRTANDLTDRLNSQIIEIENRLESAGVGVNMILDNEPFAEAGASPDEALSVLAWARGPEGWGFYVLPYLQDNPAALYSMLGDADAATALLRTSRATRIGAFPKIPRLVDVLNEEIAATLRAFEPIEKELPKPAGGGEPGGDDIPF